MAGRDLSSELFAGNVPKGGRDLSGELFGQPKQSAAYDPTEGMSTFDKAAAGAGKSVVDTGRGLKQLGALAGNKMGLVSDGAVQGIQNDVDEAKRLDAALMNTGAGQLGYLGGTISQLAVPGRVLGWAGQRLAMPMLAKVGTQIVNPSTLTSAGAIGATQGLIQPTATNESRLLNTGLGGLGGVAGNAVVSGLGRIAQPVKNVLDPIAQKAVDTLKAAGVPLDAAQQTGSAFLNRVRSSFMDNPFTMGAQRDFVSGQQAAFNKAALGTIGENANAATSDVMGNAQKRINGAFGDILDRNNVNVDMPFMQNLSGIQRRALEEEKKPIANVINRVFDATDENGQIPGQIAYGIKKDLDRMASTPDTTQNYYAREARSSLMDQINNSLNSADQQAFSNARGQFRNMKQIEGAIDKEGAGNISAPRLANTFGTKANRPQSVYGQGDQTLVDLAQSGKQLLPDRMPNSGTAARMAMQVGLPLAIGGGEGAATGDWAGGLKTAASVAAIPKVAQMMMNNPAIANYLANGIAPGLTRGLLEAPQQYGLLGGTLQRSVPMSLKGLLSLSPE